MNRKLSRLAAAGIMGFALFTGSFSASAAPAWSLPESGLQMDNASKQAYIYKEMYASFHPAKDAKPVSHPFEVPDDWTYTRFDMGSFYMEKLVNPKGSPNRTVLQLHGGGYTTPLHAEYRRIGMRQSVLSNARDTYMVDYRIAPRYPYPAALDDAFTAYQSLLKGGCDPKSIIVFGEINPNMFYEINHPSYAKGAKLDDPYLSPLYGDLTGLPPMLIQTGGYEVFLDEGMKLAEKAASDDVKVTLTVYPYMSHDFPFCVPEIQDSVDAFEEMQSFINLNMKP
jgi:monoterpene epsilon-lactone hydrolase